MDRKFFVLSVIVAIFFVAVSCEKEAEKFIEVSKNENGEHKVEYDDQNRITKLLWHDKKDDVFKKISFTYSDDMIRFKVENCSYEEYIATGSYTKLERNLIFQGSKKLVIDF